MSSRSYMYRKYKFNIYYFSINSYIFLFHKLSSSNNQTKLSKQQPFNLIFYKLVLGVKMFLTILMHRH